MRLSLITPYRDRLDHLTNQLAWWEAFPGKQDIEWMVVEVTSVPSPEVQQRLEYHQVQYLHLSCPGIFHKTKALNLGLYFAQGDFIAPFDVDLIPLSNTLEKHCFLAASSPCLLVAGYRLMAATATVDVMALAQVLERATLGPEDQPTALRKHLLHKERFGVMPLFERQQLLKIGGWDETFVGWGAEDQDLIERYLSMGQSLCRCPDLLYLHLDHAPISDWNSVTLMEQNRQYYYNKQLKRNEI